MQDQLIQVTVSALVEDQINMSPIIILHHKESNRILPIWIGDPEARAIAVALNKVSLERPLTHHLLLGVIHGMGGTLSHVEINKFEDKTYYANVVIKLGSNIIKIDARPSDCIATALTASVPIFVSKSILDSAGQENPIQELAIEPSARKIEFSQEDLKKMESLLESAREREQKSSEE